jgi:SAM-dependent methyltransferase
MISAILAKAKEMAHGATYVAYSRLLSQRTFEFSGLRYPYFYHRYNNTAETERCVEVPLAWEFLQRRAGAVLEIGNVVNHYRPVPHTVVDKYEIAEGVLNVDVCDFAPTQKFDAIVSISTIEHVGWDEQPFDPQKSLRAIEHLRQILAPSGRMFLSFPIGHNETLDAAVRDGTLGCSELRGMKRQPRNNWIEAPLNELLQCRLNPPYLHNYPKYRRTQAVVFAYF